MNLSRTEKCLRIFTEIKPGEGPTAIMMFANVFLILCAYYFIKPLREGWIAVSDISGLTKMEVKAYSSFFQAIFLFFIVGWYGRLSEQWQRSRLVTRSTLFCISNMVFFWFLQPGFFFDKLPFSGILFYLWVGMFGVFVVAQFWTFCADIYDDETGNRLLPVIAIGATSGAAFGSKIVDLFVGNGLIPSESLLIIGTIPLFLSILLTRIVDTRQLKQIENVHALTEIHKTESIDNSVKTNTGKQKKKFAFLLTGAKLVFKSRLLLAVALLTLLNNWVNTNGENLLFRVVQETLTNKAMLQGLIEPLAILEFTRDGTTAFYGNFFFWVNVMAMLLQAFVASRLLKFGGFTALILILPIIAMISYTVMALVPVLIIVKMMKIAENSTDYSLNNTARHVLWLPLDSATKFHGKPAIDTLYVRMGDGLAALTVLLGVHFFSFSTVQFFVINIFLVFLWLFFAIILIKERRKITQTS